MTGDRTKRTDEIDSREEWLAYPGVDWDADQSEVLELGIQADRGPFTLRADRDDAEIGIHANDSGTVWLVQRTADDDFSASVTMTADEAERVAEQLKTAAKAARERGGGDVRT